MGSASQPMLVIKANRALLKKRRSYKEIREQYENYTQETKLSFKQLTPFQQKLIRDKIIDQAKKDRLHNLMVSLITLIIILGILGILYVKYMI